jgi:hypothetical protein
LGCPESYRAKKIKKIHMIDSATIIYGEDLKNNELIYLFLKIYANDI